MTQISNELLTITTSGPPSAESVSNEMTTILAASPSTASITNEMEVTPKPPPGDTTRSAGHAPEIPLEEGQGAPVGGYAPEIPLEGAVGVPNAGFVAEVPLEEAQGAPVAGPAHEEALEALPSEWAGPVIEIDLSSLPIPPATKFAGPVAEIEMDPGLALAPNAGAAPEVILDSITGLEPVIETPTVVQRDAQTTFLADVAFNAWQSVGSKLTTAIEWRRGTTDPWQPATAQPYDRKHDPEDPGDIIRRLERREMIAYYKFDADLSLDAGELAKPLNNVGPVMVGTGLFTDSAQFVGNPLYYLERTANDTKLDFPGSVDFTINTWVRWSDLTNLQVILEKFTNPNGPGWSLRKLADNRLEFRYGGPPSLLVQSLDPVAAVDAAFHMITVRRRNRVLKLFYDGVELPLLVAPDEPITPLQPSSSFLRIGLGSDGLNPLNADLDETSFFERAWSNGEVLANYNEGTGREFRGTATASPGVRFNYVWDVIQDLPEGSFEDVFVRINVTANPTTSVIVGPLALSTVFVSEEENFNRALQRRALAERVEGDFLGCGLLIPFRRASRDFANACGVELIRSTVRQILGTRAAVGDFPGDLEWRPDFGCKVWILRHRNNDRGLAEQAAAFVAEAFTWEPRVQLTETIPERDPSNPNRLSVRVRYRIIDENIDENRVILPEFEEVVTI